MLISGLLDIQTTGDISDKPSSSLPVLFVRPAVTFPASECHWSWLLPVNTTW